MPIQPSTNQIIIRIITIISIVEFTIMDAITFFNADLSPNMEALLDIVLLAIFTTPFLYLWVINPYIKARDIALEELQQLIHKDRLTLLPNRRDIYTYLEKTISTAVRHNSHSAIMLLDINGLRHINDKFGNKAGDQVLLETSKRLVGRLRTEDYAGRLDSDEFIMIIHFHNKDAQSIQNLTMMLAEQIMKVTSEPINFAGTALNISVSIGIKHLQHTMVKPEAVIHDAEDAIAQAKQTKANCAISFAH